MMSDRSLPQHPHLFISILFLAALGILASTPDALAQSGSQSAAKVALVIGNGAYAVGPLRNPANDAVDVAASLRALGFAVTERVNADQRTMLDSIYDFGTALKDASIGLFYYSGHGVQEGDENYLIPIGARIETAGDVVYEGVPLGRVLNKMIDAKVSTNILILDACRDNPFPSAAKSQGTKGLAVVAKRPPESIIVYATEAGATAADGANRNGTFTEAFLKNVGRPDDFYSVLLDVKQQVQDATGFKQRPATYDNLSNKVYLASGHAVSGVSGTSGASGATNPSAVAAQAGGTVQPSATVQAGGATASALASQPKAELLVLSNPAGAEIRIDGVKVGLAGEVIYNLPSGREVALEAIKDFKVYKTKTTLHDGLNDLSISLQPLKGNLFLKAMGLGAQDCDVSINSRLLGRFGTGVFKDLDAGPADAEIRGPGLLWKDKLDLAPEKTTTKEFALQEIGSIDIRVPADAEVRVMGAFGEPFARTGGVTIKDMPIGIYNLEAGGPGYEKTSSRVIVTRDAVSRWEPWTTGSLTLTTEPSGVEVYIDNRSVGKSPLTITTMSPGQHALKASYPDHEDATGTATIAIGKTTSASMKLQISKGSIALAVPSDVSTSVVNRDRGIDRTINGASTISDLPVGVYTLESSGLNYEKVSGTLTVTRGSTGRWEPWTTGSLTVTTEPSGAEVYVDDRGVGKSPVTIKTLSPGQHALKASCPDYENAVGTATVAIGKTISASLKLQISKGSIACAVPSDVSTSVVNRDRGINRTINGASTISDLPVGVYVLESTGPGYEKAAGNITVTRGSTSRWEPWTTGTLTVTTEPSGAEVYVDDRGVGKSPVTIKTLTPGQHALKASSPDYENAVGTVTVAIGKTASTSLKLQISKGSIALAVPSDVSTNVVNHESGINRTINGAATISDLPVGLYTLESTGPDYEKASGTLIVTRGSMSRWEPWTTGTLTITTEPSGAEVYVDDRAVGKSPMTVNDLSTGNHVLKASSGENMRGSATISVAVGKTTSTMLKLEVLKGNIEIDVPEDVKVVIYTDKDRRIERTVSGAQTVSGLPVMDYYLEAAGSGYKKASGVVSVSDNTTTRWTPWKTGSLFVTTKPSRVSIFINDSYKGMSPLNIAELPSGSVLILSILDGYQDSVATTSVPVGKVNYITIDLEKKAVPVAVVKTVPIHDEVFVEGGSFMMGSVTGDGDEEPVHTVTVASFWLQKTEVTQRDYLALMGNNPSYFKGDDKPVENVSWHDALAYANQLSERDGLRPAYTINGGNVTCYWSANGWRLPTEAEWEYAARGGFKNQGYDYAGGNTVDAVAWYDENAYNKGSGSSDYGTHTVGTKAANELGVFDLSGNVWEWCWDWYGDYSAENQTNPMGAASGMYRVYRGGSWGSSASSARSAYRRNRTPGGRNYYLGFRLLRSPSS